jgi:hypothetical protein
LVSQGKVTKIIIRALPLALHNHAKAVRERDWLPALDLCLPLQVELLLLAVVLVPERCFAQQLEALVCYSMASLQEYRIYDLVLRVEDSCLKQFSQLFLYYRRLFSLELQNWDL